MENLILALNGVGYFLTFFLMVCIALGPDVNGPTIRQRLLKLLLSFTWKFWVLALLASILVSL
jgi:hypothetical protein